jgi:hypothetical protein
MRDDLETEFFVDGVDTASMRHDTHRYVNRGMNRRK